MSQLFSASQCTISIVATSFSRFPHTAVFQLHLASALVILRGSNCAGICAIWGSNMDDVRCDFPY